jgi:hypothetical protein
MYFINSPYKVGEQVVLVSNPYQVMTVVGYGVFPALGVVDVICEGKCDECDEAHLAPFPVESLERV